MDQQLTPPEETSKKAKQRSAKKQKLDSTQGTTDQAENGKPAESYAEQHTRKPGKKRKRKSAVVDESLDETEKLRRQEQRALQEKALQMRAEGKIYKRPKKRVATDSTKKNLKDPNSKPQAELTKRGQKTSSATPKKELKHQQLEGSRPEHTIQVIVVPIYWNRKPEEKKGVVQFAQRIVDLLEKSGVQSGMDTTNELSPGQKFEFWEKKGVMVRVECGPRDAKNQECVLALSKEAGNVAAKRTLLVGHELIRAVRKALGIQTEANLEATPEPEDVHMKEASQPLAGVKRPLTSGDDLGGDFGEIHLGDQTPSTTKKKRKG